MTEPQLTIIDHQADFLVIDKPANIGFHDDAEEPWGPIMDFESI